jgi:RsiW-degrading membrane proteinase PrsW (M82 family)
MLRVFLVLGSTAVILLYLFGIWWIDRYEREPWWMVAGMFLWGALGSTLLGCLASLPFLVVARGLLGPDMASGINAVVIAPVVEEAAKALIFVPVLLTASLKNRTFNIAKQIDTATDGFIYGAAIGLGFATTENLAYYAGSYDASIETLATLIGMRTAFSALVHTTSSGLLGMAIAAARHRQGSWKWWAFPAAGYAGAVLNHAVWNALAVASQFYSGAIIGGIICLLSSMALVALLTRVCLRREHEIIREYLAHEAQLGHVPADHVDIIPYARRRHRDDWLADHVDRDTYVHHATMLAFRRYQLEQDRGRRTSRLKQDISRLRSNLDTMLNAP